MLIARLAGQHPAAPRSRGAEWPFAAGNSPALPLLHWDGRVATTLIAQVEARLASGERFVVLAAAAPLGRGADRALLDRWWRAAQGRLDGRCAGWAVLVPGADVRPALLPASAGLTEMVGFPIRACADQAEALWWLRGRLAETQAASGRH